jgi:peptidoglycan/xylan/chitin deacetylase (PgdA/CDA1 family)
MKKKDIRVVLAALAASTGIIRIREYFTKQQLIVLTFHRVMPEELLSGYLFQSLAVPVPVFDELMKFLKEHYELVLLDDGLKRVKSSEKFSKPLIAITFDDGYTDNYIYAEPILSKHKILATFFIVTDLIGTDQSLWYDIAARTWSSATLSTLKQAVGSNANQDIFEGSEKPQFSAWMKFLKSLESSVRLKLIGSLKDPGRDIKRSVIDRVMNIEQIKSISDRGNQIGSHTCTHPLLPQLTDLELTKEVVQSKLELEAILNTQITAFCYPNGTFDKNALQAVSAAGYLSACTTQEKNNRHNCDPMKLGRIDMNPSRITDSKGKFHAPSFRALIAKT